MKKVYVITIECNKKDHTDLYRSLLLHLNDSFHYKFIKSFGIDVYQDVTITDNRLTEKAIDSFNDFLKRNKQ